MSSLLRLVNRDILDVEADALIYSTNVLLNCSGGVGAGLLAAYPTIQKEMHAYLQSNGLRFAQRGDIIRLKTDDMPYAQVLHTVPCDGFYETSPEIMTSLLTKCFQICHADSAIKTVAVSALGTGYGELEFADFLALAASAVQAADWSDFEITLAVASEQLYDEALKQIRDGDYPIVA